MEIKFVGINDLLTGVTDILKTFGYKLKIEKEETKEDVRDYDHIKPEGTD